MGRGVKKHRGLKCVCTLIRLKEGVKNPLDGWADGQGDTAPHLGEPGTAKTMAPGFPPESAGCADFSAFSRAAWTQLLVQRVILRG